MTLQVSLTEMSSKLNEVHAAYQKWLPSLDMEVLDVVLACACDRQIAGEPVWLFLVGNPGGTKTELLRTLQGWEVQFIDKLTSKALISGYESKTGVKINGIMQTLDRKVLLVKDLSVLLDLDRHERDAVFSQLRTAYDGELTCGYGISRELISVKATFGLIAAVTPVIDNYQTVASLLGERFLKVRATQKRWESALKAAENGGNESEMRTQLNEKTIRFLRELKETNSFNVVPEINQEQRHTLVELAEAVALARAVVKAEVVNGELGADIEPAPEYATRLVKQLTKLTQLIAIIRGHHEIQKDDIKTVIRVGKDTILPRRLMVIDVLVKCGPLNEADIIEKLSASRQQIRTALNQLELIGIVKKHGSEYEIKEEMKPYFVTLTST